VKTNFPRFTGIIWPAYGYDHPRTKKEEARLIAQSERADLRRARQQSAWRRPFRPATLTRKRSGEEVRTEQTNYPRPREVPRSARGAAQPGGTSLRTQPGNTVTSPDTQGRAGE